MTLPRAPVGSDTRTIFWIEEYEHMRGNLRRFISSRFKRAAAIAVLTCLGATAVLAQATGEPVTIGVSGPLTGQNAQYGAQWKKGFDLALEEVNKTGVKGRPLQYVFEDS